jgi:hypothetical protein
VRFLDVSLEDVVDRWQGRARALSEGGPVRRPDATPEREHRRTPAAAFIAESAADAGLFHFHFERRAHLPLPEAWAPPGQPELAEPPVWEAGVLPEAKYASFRHDLAIASFHPHHRGKWAAHELCHGLVGFAWSPRATPFFHATAGRLAELLPVALWYFFDEAFLRRCEDHQGGGDLFRVHCARCEAAAAPWPADPAAARWIGEGLRFLDAELAAIARSRRLGRPVSHRWATLDLASDGAAYARAHAPRLDSPETARIAETWIPGGGHSPSLDDLEARVVEVARALLSAEPLSPLAPSAAHGRLRWTLQDVAARVGQVLADTAGEAAEGLEAILDDLARAARSTVDPAEPDAVTPLLDARRAYDALADAYDLPDPEDVFALGYAAPGTDDGAHNLEAGLSTAAPLTLTLLGDRAGAVVAALAAEDAPTRAPLAARFADHLREHHPGPVADLAAWEAAMARLPATAPEALSGPSRGDGWRLGDHVQILHVGCDVLDLAERVESGEVDGVWQGDALTLHAHDGRRLRPEPTALLLGRDPAGEVLLLDVDPETARLLAERPDAPDDDLDPDERDTFVALGVLVPRAWAEIWPDESDEQGDR